jgi:phospholipid/cholesterol/gamma-HCH transport system substrate-binding protein
VRRHVIESVMGAVVLIVAAVFIYFAYVTAGIGVAPGYTVRAEFFKIGGLSAGSDVQISGIRVGTVSETRLDPVTYVAIVTMSINEDVKLPEDTVASIDSQGILGGKYVRLEPGQATTFIAPGGRITQTRAYRSLEDQVGEIIFLATTPGTPQAGSGEPAVEEDEPASGPVLGPLLGTDP